MTPGNIKGALLALLSMGLYSTHDVIIKLLGETYPALQVLFFSALLSFPPIALLLLRDPTPATLRRPAPLLGEHTAEVLREAGLDETLIGRLAETRR